MNLRAFLTGANVVTVNKNKKYGMTCAWAMQTDYDKVILLLGEQSETGKNISVGDVIGISALAEGQENIANLFGEKHSSEIDKFNNDFWYIKDNAILINDARVRMVAKVKDIIKLEASDDLLIYAYVVFFEEIENNFINYDKI